LNEQESIDILSSKSWNLPRAINSLLDSEQQQEEEASPQTTATPPTVAPSPSLSSIVTMPFLWTFKFIWAILSFTISYLPFLSRPRLQNQDPLDACKEFKEMFKEAYGSSGPNFFMGSYSQALDAAKRDLKYLIVYLHSHNHDDTDQFCIDTLCTETFTSFIANNDCLIWAGDIRKSEAFKVGTMVGAVKYPFMAFIAYHENRMKIVHRFLGLTSPEDCVQILSRLKEQLGPTYLAARVDR
jgi:FAS-associated factor 2